MTDNDVRDADLARRLTATLPLTPADGLARALDGLRTRAADAGLLDVAYGLADSPLGPLAVFVTERGLVRLSYQHERFDSVMDELAARVSPRILEAPERTDDVRRQLEAYFERRRTDFEVPLDWSLVRGFTAGVLQATARIPYGSVAAYSEVAAEAGNPRAARAAGNALNVNPIPIVVPCHRVLHRGGGLGGYGGGIERKQFLLRLEGVLSR